MTAHHALHHHNTVEIAAMKNDIDNMKTHFATKADMMKWTVSVGVATVLSLTGIMSGLFLNMDARMVQMNTHMLQMDTRLTNSIDTLSKKLDSLAVKVESLAVKVESLAVKVDVLAAENKRTIHR